MIADMCPSPELVNTLGLGLDIAGVILLFRFGLPPDVRRNGANYFTWGADESEARKAKQYDKISWSALGLILLGFLLQFVSTWM